MPWFGDLVRLAYTYAAEKTNKYLLSLNQSAWTFVYLSFISLCGSPTVFNGVWAQSNRCQSFVHWIYLRFDLMRQMELANGENFSIYFYLVFSHMQLISGASSHHTDHKIFINFICNSIFVFFVIYVSVVCTMATGLKSFAMYVLYTCSISDSGETRLASTSKPFYFVALYCSQGCVSVQRSIRCWIGGCGDCSGDWGL